MAKNKIEEALAELAVLGMSPDAPVTWMGLTLAAKEIAATIKELERRIESLEAKVRR